MGKNSHKLMCTGWAHPRAHRLGLGKHLTSSGVLACFCGKGDFDLLGSFQMLGWGKLGQGHLQCWTSGCLGPLLPLSGRGVARYTQMPGQSGTGSSGRGAISNIGSRQAQPDPSPGDLSDWSKETGLSSGSWKCEPVGLEPSFLQGADA